MKTTPFSKLLTTCFALGLAVFATSCGGSESESNGGDNKDPCGGKCTSTQVCDMGQCVQCTSDAHCVVLDASLPRCRLSDNTCVQCTDSAQCSGTQVCQNSVCKTSSGPIDDTPVCTLGTCSPDGTARCASVSIGGKTYFDPCPTGECENGACVEDVQECVPNQCARSDARCSADGKIYACTGSQVCISNTCSEPAANAYCGDGAINQSSEECDKSDLGGKSCTTLSGQNFTGGTLKCTSACKFDTSSCTTSAPATGGIADVRNALKGTAPKQEVNVDVAITGVTVTYVHPNGSGYFIQEGPTGPAIFVNADAGSISGTVAEGDVVSLNVTKAVRNEVKRISGFTNWKKASSGKVNTSWIQDVSDAKNITDIDTYETELITVMVTLTTDFDALGGAGSGFKKAGIKTDGYTPSSPTADFVLRVPQSMATTITSEATKLGKKATGCVVMIAGGFYWANETDKYHDTQLSIYEDNGDDNFLVDCANAEDLPGADTGTYDYTEGFSGLPNTTGTSYNPTPPYTFTNNGISWEVSARTKMNEGDVDYSIDGQGVILNKEKSSYIQASGLTNGIGKLAFTYKLWGNDSANTLTIEFFSGSTSLGTKTANAPATAVAADVIVEGINNNATSFKITSTGGKRIILDDVRWTNK